MNIMLPLDLSLTLEPKSNTRASENSRPRRISEIPLKLFYPQLLDFDKEAHGLTSPMGARERGLGKVPGGVNLNNRTHGNVHL